MKSNSKPPANISEQISRSYRLQDYNSVISLFKKYGYQSLKAQSLLVVAASFLACGEYAEAASLCESLYPTCTRDSSFYQVYGSSLRKDGLYSQASNILEEGLSLYPNDPYISNNYANCLIDLSEYEKASNILSALSTQDPPVPNLQDVLSNLQRLKLLSATSNPSSNRPATNINSSQSLDPLERAFDKSELDLSRSRYKTASIESIRHKLIEVTSTSKDDQSKALQLLKICSETASEFPTRVLKDLNIISRFHPSLPALYEVAGDCYLALHQFSDAECAYHAALSLSSKSSKVAINLANLVLVRGDRNLCINIIKTVNKESLTISAEKEAYNQIIMNLNSPGQTCSPFQVPKNLNE